MADRHPKSELPGVHASPQKVLDALQAVIDQYATMDASWDDRDGDFSALAGYRFVGRGSHKRPVPVAIVVTAVDASEAPFANPVVAQRCLAEEAPSGTKPCADLCGSDEPQCKPEKCAREVVDDDSLPTAEEVAPDADAG